jgi:hypothetical protein
MFVQISLVFLLREMEFFSFEKGGMPRLWWHMQGLFLNPRAFYKQCPSSTTDAHVFGSVLCGGIQYLTPVNIDSDDYDGGGHRTTAEAILQPRDRLWNECSDCNVNSWVIMQDL